jgi:lipopolysaccharide biosynthesis glycosyltransferase
MPAGRHGLAAYLRLLIPHFVHNTYDRILYLDSDIVCNGSDFNHLLSVDLEGHWLAAVRDNTQWRTPGSLNPEFRALGRPAQSYFNSGILLIDIHEWHHRNIFRQGLDVLRHQSKAVYVVDQSILNIVVNGCWAETSPLWNWQFSRATRYFADLADPFLIHFIGPRKPWKDTGNALPARFRRHYKAFLQDFWPSFSAVSDSIDANQLGWPPDAGRSFIKHTLSLRSMRNYLARFQDPYHLISLPDDAAKHRSFV